MMGLLHRWLGGSAPAQALPQAADDGAPERVAEEIGRSRQRISERVGGIKALTEREILACGGVLSSIVEHVRAIITQTDRALADSSARADQSTSRFIADLSADSEAQEAAAARVLSLTDSMQEAIEAINGLSQYSNLLAINSRIEAARIGEQGRGFAVIADQTRDLSKTIRDAADRVASSIDAIRRGIPEVRSRASAIQRRTQAYITEVGKQVKDASSQTATGTEGSKRLEAVVRLSNQALSHLQFQDPVVQELAAIDQDLEVLAARTRRVLQGELDLEPIENLSTRGAGQPAPGKITFFEEKMQ